MTVCKSETIKQLKKLRIINSIIKSKKEEIAELRTGVFKGQKYSDDLKNGNKSNSAENLNLRIIDKTNEIYAEIDRLYTERNSIVYAIDNLEDPQESLILRLFYVNNYSWKEISIELGGSPKTWQNVRKSGVNNLSKVLSKNSQISLLK